METMIDIIIVVIIITGPDLVKKVYKYVKEKKRKKKKENHSPCSTVPIPPPCCDNPLIVISDINPWASHPSLQLESRCLYPSLSRLFVSIGPNQSPQRSQPREATLHPKTIRWTPQSSNFSRIISPFPFSHSPSPALERAAQMRSARAAGPEVLEWKWSWWVVGTFGPSGKF